MKTDAQEIARLKLQLAQMEMLLQGEKLKHEVAQTMITIAEKDGAARAVQHFNPKKAWPQTVNQLSLHHPLVSMATLCGLFGVSRQAWYEKQKRSQKADLKSALVLAEVRRLRLDLPSVGAEILHYQLADFRQQHGIKLGRDKFTKLLRDNGLLIRRKTRRAQTTWSKHPFRKYPNLAKGKKVDAPNQQWVSDITYLPLPRGFAYLSLVTDAYSRKIVGWALHPTLEMEGPLAALKMALKRNKVSEPLIHHSDRGVQYCGHAYTGLLQKNKIAISMTEQGDPYENALAERVNRTIKEDMLLNRSFISYAAAEEAVQRAIENYNQLRPHRSCSYYTAPADRPEQAHRMQGELVKKWRVTKRRQAVKMQSTESMAVA